MFSCFATVTCARSDKLLPTSPTSTVCLHFAVLSGIPSMSAPNPSRDGIPPPLPPPRHIDDLNKGQDLGWQWANGIRPDPSHPDHLPYGASIDNRVEQLRPITENQRPNNFYSQSLPAHSTGHIPSIERSESRDDDRLPRPNLARYVLKHVSTTVAAHTLNQSQS